MCCVPLPQFWAAYVPCDSQWMDAVPLSLEQIDVVRRLVQQYPQYLSFATSSQGEPATEPRAETNSVDGFITANRPCKLFISFHALLPVLYLT